VRGFKIQIFSPKFPKIFLKLHALVIAAWVSAWWLRGLPLVLFELSHDLTDNTLTSTWRSYQAISETQDQGFSGYDLWPAYMVGKSPVAIDSENDGCNHFARLMCGLRCLCVTSRYALHIPSWISVEEFVHLKTRHCTKQVSKLKCWPAFADCILNLMIDLFRRWPSAMHLHKQGYIGFD